MKLYGSLKELVDLVFRKSTFQVTVQPSTASADTTFQLPAAGGGTKAIVTADATQTLTNKTLTSPVIGTETQLQNQATAKFFEQTGNGTNYIGLQAPDSVAADKTFKLPATDGTTGQVLKTDGTANLGWVSAVTNPMAATGDMIYGGTSGVPTNLATGSTAGVLHGGNGATPSWSQVVNADVAASAAIAGSKLQAASASNTGTVSLEENAVSWTPSLSFSGGNSTSSITVNSAKYCRIGKIVTVDLAITLTKSGTPSGNYSVTGLPYAANSDSNYSAWAPMQQNQTNASWFARVASGASAVEFMINTGNTTVTAADVATGAVFRVTLVYRAA